MKRKRSLRTYVPCPACGHRVCLQGSQIPVHRDHRFDLEDMRCPASGQGMLFTGLVLADLRSREGS